jgi:hypothetical protein
MDTITDTLASFIDKVATDLDTLASEVHNSDTGLDVTRTDLKTLSANLTLADS